VFDGLIIGLSEKELASQLGLSRHTVHGHVQRLYRDAGVSSRGELLAAHIRRLELRVAELERAQPCGRDHS
jgi:DNA-binding CsgD family transcriptional regulator